MASRFQETRWTLVIAAAGDSSRGRQALGELCEQYWSPLFAFARARGLTPEDAQDATQGFFEQLIARGDLALADPARGRFRAFLLVAFKHFMANERDRARTLKRGGGQTFVPLDAVDRRDRAGPTTRRPSRCTSANGRGRWWLAPSGVCPKRRDRRAHRSSRTWPRP